MPLQIQRLLELQSYLNGGVSDWPAPAPEPAPVKQEIHVPEPTGNNRPVLNPDSAMDLFPEVKVEPVQAKARAPTAAPVSKWTLAEDTDTDQQSMPVSKWMAQEVSRLLPICFNHMLYVHTKFIAVENCSMLP